MKNSRIQELKNKILSYRFIEMEPELFVFFEELLELCRAEGDEEGLAFASFYLGEAYYRLGDYDKALHEINQGLTHKGTSMEAHELEARSYNLKGLMVAEQGSQVFAYDHYLEALNKAVTYQCYSFQPIIYINIGTLYRELGGERESLRFYDEGIRVLQEHRNEFHDYDLESLLQAYRGLAYIHLGEMDKAFEIYDRLMELRKKSENGFYDVSIENMEILVSHYRNQPEEMQAVCRKMLNRAKNNPDFKELHDFYVEIAEFFLKFDYRVELRQLLNCMHENTEPLNNIFVTMKIQVLETEYQKRYGTEEDYFDACQNFYRVGTEYDKVSREAKLFSLNNLEALSLARKEQKFFEEKSRRDSMTGLLNKVATEDEIQTYMNYAPTGHQGAFILLDLDSFKCVNDSLGHLEGDNVIKLTAQMIQATFRYNDVMGRVGGDEFVVFMKDIKDKDMAMAKAKELAVTVEGLREHGLTPWNTSVSIGVAVWDGTEKTYKELFSRADQALYEAKKNGKGQVVKN